MQQGMEIENNIGAEDVLERAGIEQSDKNKKPRKKRSVFAILLDVELVFVVALVCAFIVPQLFGFVPDVVMSASMEPKVPEGAVAYINENVEPDELEVGDIAVYKPSDSVQVLHRVQTTDGSTFTFKGDANREADAGTVDASQVQGRYMFHIPIIGYAYVFFDKHRVGVIVAVVLINLLVYALSERQIRREEEEAADARVQMQEDVRAMVEAMMPQSAATQNATIQNAGSAPQFVNTTGSGNVAAKQANEMYVRAQAANEQAWADMNSDESSLKTPKHLKPSAYGGISVMGSHTSTVQGAYAYPNTQPYPSSTSYQGVERGEIVI